MRVICALTMVAAVSAFSPAAFGVRSSTKLFDKIDSSAAVEKAMAASKEFGKSSKEAAAAWDVVEEIDASNSHAAKMEADAAAAASNVATPAAVKEKKETFVISERDEAVAEAKKITEEKGISSPEARVAWELVEELAATESHHNKYGTG